MIASNKCDEVLLLIERYVTKVPDQSILVEIIQILNQILPELMKSNRGINVLANHELEHVLTDLMNAQEQKDDVLKKDVLKYGLCPILRAFTADKEENASD